MLGSLFSRISDALGKAFVFAGLLPAGVLLAGWFWYFGGTSLPVKSLGEITWSSAPADVLAIAALWGSIGLALHAARGPILALFERAPNNGLIRYFVRRSMNERDRAARYLEYLDWLHNVSLWYEDAFSEERTRYVPETMPSPAWYEDPLSEERARYVPESIATPSPASDEKFALGVSRLARFGLAALATNQTVFERRTAFDEHLVLDGMVTIYLLTSECVRANQAVSPAVKSELEEWRRAALEPGAPRVLKTVAGEVFRQSVAAKMRCDLFPAGVWIRPTALGNRLAALDDYAEKRYGMDTGVLWSRLWWILPDEARRAVGDAKLGVEVLINLALTMLILAAASASHAASCGTGIGWEWSLCGIWRVAVFVAGALVLAHLAYRAANIAVESLMRQITTLIDLHRHRLLVALGHKPETVAEELKLFKELKGFLVQTFPRYPHRRIVFEAGGAKEKKNDGKAS